MIQEFKSPRKDDEIRVKIDITVERLGIYEFERCVFNPDTCRMTASVTTTFYRKGA